MTTIDLLTTKIIKEEVGTWVREDPDFSLGHYIRKAIVKFKLTYAQAVHIAQQFKLTLQDVLEGP